MCLSCDGAGSGAPAEGAPNGDHRFVQRMNDLAAILRSESQRLDDLQAQFERFQKSVQAGTIPQPIHLPPPDPMLK